MPVVLLLRLKHMYGMEMLDEPGSNISFFNLSPVNSHHGLTQSVFTLIKSSISNRQKFDPQDFFSLVAMVSHVICLPFIRVFRSLSNFNSELIKQTLNLSSETAVVVQSCKQQWQQQRQRRRCSYFDLFTSGPEAAASMQTYGR